MKKLWPPEDIALLEREYANTNTATLAAQMDRTPSSVYQKALGMGLKKSAAYMAESLAAAGRHAAIAGKSSRFKAGQKAWNTGIKGICGTHENCRRTQFKKGSMSGAAQHNYVPIGSERLSKDGYLERKVTDAAGVPPRRRWVGVHRLVWEAANGPVPRGHVVCFLAGRRSADAETITLDALELVSRKELARRNHPVTRSPELARLVQLKGAITRQLNRIAREAKGGK